MIAALVLSATLTIHDYATMPQLSTPRWSPDGRRIAYVVTKADLERSVYDSDIWLVDADGKHDRQLTRARGADFRPRWSPDGTRIAFVSDRDGKNAVWVIDPSGGEARKLIDEPTPVREVEWSPDGKWIAFTRLDEPTPEEEKKSKERDDARVIGDARKYVHLYLADAESGKARKLTKGSFSIWTFSWSPDGKSIAFDRGPGAGLDDMYRADIYAIDVQSGQMRALVSKPGPDRHPVYSRDGKWLAFTTAGVHDWLVEHELHVMPANGGPSRHVSKSYDRTPDDFFWSGDALWIEGPYNTTTQLYRVNADGSGWTDTTNFAGTVSDAQVHGGRAAYVRQSVTSPPELYVQEVAGSGLRGAGGHWRDASRNPQPATRHDAQRLTNHNAAYRDVQLGETRLIRWTNPKDGLEIEGLLTLPVGYAGGTRVPLLTFVHGGPASRFEQGFLGYLGTVYAPQVLAANGFAVLRPNPRGTGGYGAAFRRANRNDWGGMDWIDINAGIDKVIADGIGDPERLGMMGWSYGGFMASWAVARSDRFKAISIGAPVVDLLSFHGTTDIRDFLPHYFDERETPDTSLDEMRHAPLSLELLRRHSPLWHLKKTNARVLVQHGDADDRVPLSQGTMLYRILDELGVDVQMVVYPRQPHVPREPKLRMDVMRRNLELFQAVTHGR